MECCTCRQCSSVICCTVDGMLHIQAMFVCYMLHSWWNVAHTGNVRLLYATQLMDCCTHMQCSSVICCTVDGMLHIQAMFVCYMLHSWWMECCTYRMECSPSVICCTVDGMLHIQAMLVCYMLHSWWNVALTSNIRLLYDTQLMQRCTCRQCSSVICYTVDGMLHRQEMFACYMIHMLMECCTLHIQAMFVCYTLHSWWNVAHKGNIRLSYVIQLMECSSVICYTVDGMLHIQAIRLLYATQLMECCT